jgi:hypothetical protein
MKTSVLVRPEGRSAYETARTQANWSFLFPTRPARAGESGSGTWSGRGRSKVEATTHTSRSPTTFAIAVVRHLRRETAPVA